MKETAVYIAMYEMGEHGYLKIGITGQSIEKRLQGIQSPEKPNNVLVLVFENDIRASKVERGLHALFEEYRRNGEWFMFNSYDELKSKLEKAYNFLSLALSLDIIEEGLTQDVIFPFPDDKYKEI